MTIAVMTLLLLVCAVVLAYPFLARQPASAAAGEDITEQLRRTRDRVYEEIRALQQEYFLENLTEEEYQSQLGAARRQAAELIRQQQHVQATLQDVEAQVEEELRLAAARAGASPELGSEAQEPRA